MGVNRAKGSRVVSLQNLARSSKSVFWDGPWAIQVPGRGRREQDDWFANALLLWPPVDWIPLDLSTFQSP